MELPLSKAVIVEGVFLFLVLKLCRSQEMIKHEYHIEEDSGDGVLVGNAGRDSGLFSKFQKEVNLLMFQPFAQGNELVSYFNVNSSTGVIRTARNIDREVICLNHPKCVVKLGIAVYRRFPTSESPTLINILDITVFIHDINDKRPIFPSQSVTLQVAENQDVNYQIETSVATDADEEGDNSRITYRIVPSNDLFELSTVRTTDGVEDLVITIKRSLDREEKSLYKLLVVATDLGDDPKSGSLFVNIQVTDMNDNSPQFGQLNYSVNVLENSDISGPVIVVAAYDRDDGQNARISYSFSFHVAQDIRETFRIEQFTGKIFSRKQLDFETKQIYQFSVVATDHGSPAKSSSAYVTINVIDVNDNIPVIQVNPAPGGDSVIEHGSVGKFLAYIKVTDADSFEFGRVSCDILDPCFDLDLVDVSNLGFYKIKLRRGLDREETPTRDVVITCQDNDVVPRSSSASFQVAIKDINDNHPTFLESSLYGSVMENRRGSVYIVQVIATDPDEGENSRVTFSFTSGSDVYLFSINPITGTISTTGMLDREMSSQYFLEVTASDNGDNRLQTTATVTIRVEDENDNPPRFEKQEFVCSVLENLPAGSLSESLSAYDPDSEENSRFVFSIIDDDLKFGDESLFRIDPTTGLLWSGVTFNREEKSVYKFKVKVADPYVSSFSDIANVTVNIEDENDHAPYFVKPTPTNRTFYCPFNTTVGDVVTSFVASDEDDPRLVDISYHILSANRNLIRSSLFTIGPTSGKLRLARQIKPDDIGAHTLEVVVKDGLDRTAQSASTTIIVIVEKGSEEAMRQFSDGSKTNVIIIIIIIAATFILILIIIFFICLLKRVDRKRRTPLPSGLTNINHKMYQAAKWVSSVSVTKEIGPEEVTSVLEFPIEKKSKKKEVSFSLDGKEVVSLDEMESQEHNFCRPLHMASGVDGLPFEMNTRHGDFIVMNGMTTPDYSQHLYDVTTTAVHPQDEHHFVEVRHAEDRYSDASSGDTGTSDSGRGGSEDEGHNQTSSSVDGEMQKLRNGGSLNRLSNPTSKSSNRRSHENSSTMNRLKQIDSSAKESEDVPGSPTPLLSDKDRQERSHSYIRRTLDKNSDRGRRSSPSSSSSQSSSTPCNAAIVLHNPQRIAGEHLKLSHKENERMYIVPKKEQLLLQTFSSSHTSRQPLSNSYQSWTIDTNINSPLEELSSSPYKHNPNKTKDDLLLCGRF